MGKIKFLYHIPHTNTIYAGRTISNGYKNAILDMGHDFKYLTAEVRTQKDLIESYKPNILMMSLSRYSLKFIDIKMVRELRKQGLKVFVNTPFWKSPLSKTRINEVPGLSENKELLDFIVKDRIGDVYYNVCEPEDERMGGFEEATSYKRYTIPLAADKITLKGDYRERFKADVSYIGTNLPQKRAYFNEVLFPLGEKYNLNLYGQDWYLKDRLLGWVQRGGQYLNIPVLKNAQKPKLKLEDEANIYKSSIVSVNIHEDYQRKYGGDCNERTFKIPLSEGFEITDDVECIRKYFKEDAEIVVAKNKDDWFDKIDYYIKNPEKRLAIMEAGRKRVLADHTYHNRAETLLDIYKNI